jgi:predicted nucleic acid-binding protein
MYLLDSSIFLELFLDQDRADEVEKLLRSVQRDVRQLAEAAQQFNLDFDDAYQYALAERYNLTIVSFDSDFDRTERGRKVPKDLLDG